MFININNYICNSKLTKIMETTIKYNNVELTVYYGINGKYYPATQYDPEEHPETEIVKITVKDSEIDIKELFLESQLDEIYELIG